MEVNTKRKRSKNCMWFPYRDRMVERGGNSFLKQALHCSFILYVLIFLVDS